MSLRPWFEDVRKRYKIAREKPQLWLFEEAGFGYIQIPKVATRSIRQALMSADGLRRTDESFDDFEMRCSSHLSHAQLRARTAGRRVFAFVRHPLARLHSAYVDKIVEAEREGARNIFRCHGIAFGISFDEFVERVCAMSDSECDRHLRSQKWFLADEHGLIPSFIGKLESFADDWARLREQLPCLGEIGHVNRAAYGMNHAEHYSPRTLSLAQARYEADFALFDYERS